MSRMNREVHPQIHAKKAAAGPLKLVFSSSLKQGAEEANIHLGRRYSALIFPQLSKLCLLLIKMMNSTKHMKSPKASLNA